MASRNTAHLEAGSAGASKHWASAVLPGPGRRHHRGHRLVRARVRRRGPRLGPLHAGARGRYGGLPGARDRYRGRNDARESGPRRPRGGRARRHALRRSRRRCAVPGRLAREVADGLGRPRARRSWGGRSRRARFALPHALATAAERVRCRRRHRAPIAQPYGGAWRWTGLRRLRERRCRAVAGGIADACRRRLAERESFGSSNERARARMAVLRWRLHDAAIAGGRGERAILLRVHDCRSVRAPRHGAHDLRRDARAIVGIGCALRPRRCARAAALLHGAGRHIAAHEPR